MTKFLYDARRYELQASALIADDERPAFHLSSYTGWMNDPNGFSFYRGRYHLFYQYNPYASRWDTMHWGHAVSEDLLRWSFLPAALAPDQHYDQDGCFSGSAFVTSSGEHMLMYTGVRLEKDELGRMREVQTQSVACGDGLDYQKYAHNPVLTEEDLPEGSSRFDFRDPKIWRSARGDFLALIASRPADGSGQLLLFRSPDGFTWRYWKVLLSNGNRLGKMWECPDLFELDGKGVLLVSPQDMLPRGLEYHNGNGTLCLIGHFDEEKGEFIEEHDQAIDYGIDFYAPQTLLTEDNRRVMIGWMQNWDACAIRESASLWAGQMSLPRELRVRDGRLYQLPIRELDSLRRNERRYDEVLIQGRKTLAGIEGRVIDLELELRSADPSRVYRKFTMDFAQNKEHRSSIIFRPYNQTLTIDRQFSGSRRAIVHQRSCLVKGSADGSLKLRIVLDRFSAELFINEGEMAMSTSLYTPLDAVGIRFDVDGEALLSLKKYELVL